MNIENSTDRNVLGISFGLPYYEHRTAGTKMNKSEHNVIIGRQDFFSSQ